jgi:hypothetical protein
MVVDYSNKKPINSVPVKADETLVPIHAEEIVSNYRNDLKDGLRTRGDGINLNNLETWHLGGRKILVGFVAVKKEQAESAIANFWSEVNTYIEATRKKRCLISDGKGGFKRCPREKSCDQCKEETFTSYELSLDEFMGGSEDDGEGSWDPTGDSNIESSMESSIALRITLAELINDLKALDPAMAKCITLLSEGYEKKEVIEALDLNVKKTQAYSFVEKCQKKAKEMYDKKYR